MLLVHISRIHYGYCQYKGFSLDTIAIYNNKYILYICYIYSWHVTYFDLLDFFLVLCENIQTIYKQY